MNVRTAKRGDRPAIRDVARRSLQASYSLSPEAITGAVSEWYDEAALDEATNDEDRHLLVADREGQVVGFAESELAGGDATLLWLHVDPAYRGEGVGTALFEETRERLTDAGADRMVGRVLADNIDGNGFYEAQGFERVDEAGLEIAGHHHVENVWAESGDDGLQAIKSADGATVYVDETDWDDGSAAKFYTVYSDEDGTDHYGYFCSNCNRLANAMDAMGRIECDSCGNARKPTRWDAAYL
ncbi:GNAT family N-acetyltransferase [Halosimplex litoreum]|uniref:GNAT family N-acetyltransferase n=1 Tax=Halosimplex litoreum TaxID=1198301 RepID=A0A7T3FY26_9EURY|nr:GNAT family N-acetyltransferase [Halosimplex litoreum]QPV62408.1 GNAT family N-acetyltransferase [Halosimplex litoreum]